MAHANARLNVFGRGILVERVAAGHRPGEVAKQLGVSRATVYKWVRRFRVEGLAGLADRSSRPHRSPRQVPAEQVTWIVARRRDEHVGARELARLLECRPARSERFCAAGRCSRSDQRFRQTRHLPPAH
ncbi:MAG: leucine zipper domain-containing protein [Lapillicoccus sp.]